MTYFTADHSIMPET